MDGITVLDLVVGAIVAIGVVRGAFVGMIREGFSIAAIGAAVLGVRYGATPAGAYLNDLSAGELGFGAAKWAGGLLCGILAAVLVGGVGRWLRRGARVVGLGMADRIGGVFVGAAEGALVGALLIVGASYAMGRNHPQVNNAYSVAVFEEVQTSIQTGVAPNIPGLPSVGSGPPPESQAQQP